MANLGSLIVSLGIDTRQLKTAGGRFRSITKSMTNSIFSLKGALAGLGAGLAFKGVISQISEFETRIAEVSTLIKGASVDTKQLEDNVISMARTIGKDAGELAAGAYQVLSAGITDATESMEVLEVAAKASIAGLTSTFTAVDILTTALNAYGLEAEAVDSVSDILFTTVRLGKTTFEQLAGTLGTVLPFSSQLGVSLEEVGAAMATLTASGLSTDIAATALRSTFVSLIQNVDKFKKIGIDVLDVVGKKGLAGVMLELKEATQGNIEKIQELFPETRSLTAVLTLAGKQSEAFAEALKEQANATGATEEAFGKMSATMSRKWAKVTAGFQAGVLQMRGALIPLLQEFLLRIQGVADAVAGWVEVNQEVISSTVLSGFKALVTIAGILFKSFLGLQMLWNRLKLGALTLVKAFKQGLDGLELIPHVLKIAFRKVIEMLSRGFLEVTKAFKSGFEAINIFGIFDNKISAIEQEAERLSGVVETHAAATESATDAMVQARKDQLTALQGLQQEIADTENAYVGLLEKEQSFIDFGESVKESIQSRFDFSDLEGMTAGLEGFFGSSLGGGGDEEEGDQTAALDSFFGADLVEVAEEELTFLQELIMELFGEDSEVREALDNLFPNEEVFEGLNERIEEWAERVSEVGSSVGKILTDTFDKVAEGMGNAVAGAIVSGKNLGDSLKSLWNSVIKSIIAGLIKIGIQRLILSTVVIGAQNKEFLNELKNLAITTFGHIFDAVSQIPIIGPILALPAAVAGTAIMLAGALAVGGGIADAGLESVPSRSTFLLDQGERVLARPQNEDLTEFLEQNKGSEGGEGDVVLQIDGNEFARIIAPGIKEQVGDGVDFGLELKGEDE